MIGQAPIYCSSGLDLGLDSGKKLTAVAHGIGCKSQVPFLRTSSAMPREVPVLTCVQHGHVNSHLLYQP
jgi:hypothetical protein